MKDTAAIFVASGHGLTEVNIPSHMADETRRKPSIYCASFKNSLYFILYILKKFVLVPHMDPDFLEDSSISPLCRLYTKDNDKRFRK